MIFRWTPFRLCGISCLAVGRIGLRRSATRAPGGRSHARGTGPLLSTPFRFYFARYRLSGIRLRLGRLATLVMQRDFLVVEVMSLKANRQRSIHTLFDDHPAATLAGTGGLEQLEEPIAKPDRVIVAHHALALDRQDRFQAMFA